MNDGSGSSPSERDGDAPSSSWWRRLTQRLAGGPRTREDLNELLDGARSLGELDVARALKAHSLPAPQRQVLRRDGRGRYYLDLYWPQFRLVVEIDGIHHAWAESVVGDALRQNALTLQGDRVLRLQPSPPSCPASSENL